VTSFNLVKVTAAFVAGVVVALGSALIYMRANDPGHIPASQTSVGVPSIPAEIPPPPSDTSPEPKPVVPERKAQHRHTVLTNAPSKPSRKPIQIAQNDAHPALKMPQPAVESVPPQSVSTPTPPAEQPNTDTPPAAEPSPMVPPDPQPHVVTLPSGTVLAIRLGETLSTEHNYTGDTFRATLLSPLIQDGFIIADKGSKVLGRVVSAQSAGHLANVAALSLVVTELNTTDGQRVQVMTNMYSRRGNSNVGQDTAKIAGGAALGAIIGGIAGGGKGAAIGAGAGGAAGTGAVLLTHGKPAVVENETQITFRLASPVTITEKLN
jgi:hypothetical protein